MRSGIVAHGSIVAALVLLAACTGDLLPRQRKAAHFAGEAGWAYRSIEAGAFDIASYSSPAITAASDLLSIYIEGDGLAFVDEVTPSADPTPRDPIALRLAIAAPQRPAAYLARPCQYVMRARLRGCDVAYWTSRRYAPEIVDAMDRSVDEVKRLFGARRVVLVGYSGGGALAVLLAARRRDVAAVLTIGANLDLGYWTHRDKLAPLAGSMDPASVARQVAEVPQVHFAGSRDRVVGADVVRAYLAHLPRPNRATLVEIDGFSHICCWVDAWPKLVARQEIAAITGWR